MTYDYVKAIFNTDVQFSLLDKSLFYTNLPTSTNSYKIRNLFQYKMNLYFYFTILIFEYDIYHILSAKSMLVLKD